jgi:endonuclease/exonuclease/phosphatase family metal-dependent hydrolase
MIRLFAILLLLAATLVGGEHVKIASYNVENLFDLHYEGSEYPEYIPNSSWQWNAENFHKKLNNIARVIADLRPDIISLQEVESETALKALQKTLTQKGLYFKYRAFAGAKNSTVKTALLSRYPIQTRREIWVSHHRKFRNILEVKLSLEGKPLYLFVNHWKSKSGPESMRVQSAKALKKRLDELGDVPCLLVGDFNSHYEEHLLFCKKRKHNDTGGITGINHILKTVNDNAPITLEKLRKCEACAYNLWYEIPIQKRWSHNFWGKKEALDSMIISPALADQKGVDYMPGSFSRFAPDYLFHKRGIYRWQQSRKHPKHHLGKGYSDHLPIYAEFVIH